MRLRRLLVRLRPTKAHRTRYAPVLRALLLLPVPALFCVASHFGWLSALENLADDARYHIRGGVPTPAVNLKYVDIDSIAIQRLHNFPWPREYFAQVCKALVQVGGAKAVGIDVVFSEAGMTDAVDPDQWVRGNVDFASYLYGPPPKVPPPVYLACSYGATRHFSLEDPTAVVTRKFPFVYERDFKLDDADLPELPEFRRNERATINPPRTGIIDTYQEQVRWVAVFAPTQVKTYYSLGFELALRAWGATENGVKIFDDHVEVRSVTGQLVATVPLARKQLLEVNWFSAWEPDPPPLLNPKATGDEKKKQDELVPPPPVADSSHVSFFKILLAAQALAKSDPSEADLRTAMSVLGKFKDAVVLVGPVDPFLQDLSATPMDSSPVPKVSVHGNVFRTLMTGDYVRRVPFWVECLIVFGLALGMTTLATSGEKRTTLLRVLALLLGVVYVVATLSGFIVYGWILPFVAPMGAAVSTSFLALGWQLVVEQKHKGRIKGMFGTYVAPALVEKMVESGEEPKLGGVEAEITAYFSDIQSFSTFSEKLTPPQLVELMNEYLTACTDIVQAEGGTLDKYIGDAVVAMYGAPLTLHEHAHRACIAALRVHKRIWELRGKWEREEAKGWPDIVLKLQTRIGLNSGPCVVGNMGSHTRFNYTMMGDNVNLAARMESGAKHWGVYTMCTEATKLACQAVDRERVVFRPLNKIVVKGRSQPVPIYELVGLKEDVSSQTHECLGVFAEALALYYARDWDGAIAKFRISQELEPNQPGKTPGVVSNASLSLIHVSEEMREHPPGNDWDGRYVMKEK